MKHTANYAGTNLRMSELLTTRLCDNSEHPLYKSVDLFPFFTSRKEVLLQLALEHISRPGTWLPHRPALSLYTHTTSGFLLYGDSYFIASTVAYSEQIEQVNLILFSGLIKGM